MVCFHQRPFGLSFLDESIKNISLRHRKKRLIAKEAARRHAEEGAQTQDITGESLETKMVGVQEVEKAADDMEDALQEPPFPERLAAISALMWFSPFYGLLSSFME